jgi:hypothetical protein
LHLIDAADLLAVLEDAIVLEVLERGRCSDIGRTKGSGIIGLGTRGGLSCWPQLASCIASPTNASRTM